MLNYGLLKDIEAIISRVSQKHAKPVFQQRCQKPSSDWCLLALCYVSEHVKIVQRIDNRSVDQYYSCQRRRKFDVLTTIDGCRATGACHCLWSTKRCRWIEFRGPKIRGFGQKEFNGDLIKTNVSECFVTLKTGTWTSVATDAAGTLDISRWWLMSANHDIPTQDPGKAMFTGSIWQVVLGKCQSITFVSPNEMGY